MKHPVCYNKTVERKGEERRMNNWYIVKCGAEVREEIFESREMAERFAHRLTCEQGHKWHVELASGAC